MYVYIAQDDIDTSTEDGDDSSDYCVQEVTGLL